MGKLNYLIDYLKGGKQERAGYEAGREKHDAQLWKQAKNKAREELTGKQLLSELQKVKNSIGENCSKCKRTRHGYCNRCNRTLKGLDHLAGRIAYLYTDKKERWKRDKPV